MKKHLFVAYIAAASIFAAGAKSTDDVLMTVDGKDIHVSEFKYLYNKNNSQQLEPQTLDQYLEMFKNYKLKVADAEHAGIQNTPAFQKEFENFRQELSAPYFIDKEFEDSLINESYNHRLTELVVSHIMLANEEGNGARLDSIRTQILNGNITFENAARQFSIDRGSGERGGYMGNVIADRYPWPFEEAAYKTPQGGISPVINSGFGYHIIRTDKVQPTEGEVKASHILLMTRGLEAAEAEKQKVLADSLYNVLVEGADFATIAKEYSQDPGSAAKGGDLGWFGRGMMVAEFDSTAFALPDGGLSKPFTTGFGYHIIKRYESRMPGPLDEATRKEIKQKMANDARAQMPAQAQLLKFLRAHNASASPEGFEKAVDIIRANDNRYDSLAIANLKASDIVMANYDDKVITLAEVMNYARPTRASNLEAGVAQIQSSVISALNNAVLSIERDRLATENEDYRNLINEYRDGILLYEISNINVWDKAGKDTEGLNTFFHNNIDKYKWDQPKFKSYVIFAKSDSVLQEAVAYAAELPADKPAEFTSLMRKKFGHDVKVERVVAAKGENAITDYLGFGADKPADDNKSRWAAYAGFNGRIIDGPEEAADVRGAAVSDYQAELEKEWLSELHKKYKVKVNKKVFEKLKKETK